MSELRKLRYQLDQKFEELKKELQDNCSHKEISEWMDERWEPDHPLVRVKQCNRCGKEMDRVIAKMFDDELSEDIEGLGSET